MNSSFFNEKQCFFSLAQKVKYLPFFSGDHDFWTLCWEETLEKNHLLPSPLLKDAVMSYLAEAMWNYGRCALTPETSYLIFDDLLRKTGFPQAVFQSFLENITEHLQDGPFPLTLARSLVEQEWLKRLICSHTQEDILHIEKCSQSFLPALKEIGNDLSVSFSHSKNQRSIIEKSLQQLELIDLPTRLKHEILKLFHELIENSFLWFEWRFLSFSGFQAHLNDSMIKN
jgi:hypothetical protein